MEKEFIVHWLRQCSDQEQDGICEECPFGNCEDCAGALMAEAARALEESGGCGNG